MMLGLLQISSRQCLHFQIARGLLKTSLKFPSTFVGSSVRYINASNAMPEAAPTHTIAAATAYSPSKTGILSFLPVRAVPYAELIRLDKPAGAVYLFFPCLWSTLLGAPLVSSSPALVGTTTLLFVAGAWIMRGAGCAINDLWDRNLDFHVIRTRHRPLARGALTPQQAIVFTGVQLLAGLGVLVSLPSQCLWYGLPSLVLVTLYPLAKRVTYYPQVVLGATFSWGAIMGFPALGVDLLANEAALTAAACLYASSFAWSVFCDLIYAHMDLKDDVKAGIKSMVVRHGHQTKTLLSALATVQVGFLAMAGIAVGASPVYFLGACGSAIVSLGTTIYKVNLNSVSNCWWWFKSGCWFTGGSVSLGMFAEYFVQYMT